MIRTELPDGFNELPFDARMPLPLRSSVSIDVGTAEVILVASPSNLAAVAAHGLEEPWLNGETTLDPLPAEVVAPGGFLTHNEFTQLEVARPGVVVTVDHRVVWAYPLVVGQRLTVIDHSALGVLFDLYFAVVELKTAALRRPADVGSRLVAGYLDRRRGSPWNHVTEMEEDLYDSLV